MMTCDEVREQLQIRYIKRTRVMRARPYMRIWDKNWNFKAVLLGEISATFEEKLNDTGTGEVKLFGTHPLKDWLINELDQDEDVHLTVDVPGKRWSGKAQTIGYSSDDKGTTILTLTFLHEYEHMKKMVCYANPLLPPEFQYPKLYLYAGPSIDAIKTMIFLNLRRRFAAFWSLPSQIWDGSNWLSNMNPNNWPIIVVPNNFFTDTSPWTVLTTRFGVLHDTIAPTLADAKLHLTAKRWLPGDPQPAPGHYFLTRPTLVIDVVEKSGVNGPSGTVFDGLLKLASTLLSDGVQEVITQGPMGPPPVQYTNPGFFGTVNSYPWVSWRNGMKTGLTGIQTWDMTIHKALASTVVTGGKSPQWVNGAIKLLLNGVLGYLGMLFGNPALALGIFDSQVEDVFLAFHRVENLQRQARMGYNNYGEHWENDQGTGFSLSALQAIRVGMWSTRAYTSFKITVINGAPYWVGRHFDLGDRVSAEIGDTGQLYVDNVFGLTLSWSRTEDPAWQIQIGNGEAEEMPGSILARQVEQIKAVIQSITASA